MGYFFPAATLATIAGPHHPRRRKTPPISDDVTKQPITHPNLSPAPFVSTRTTSALLSGNCMAHTIFVVVPLGQTGLFQHGKYVLHERHSSATVPHAWIFLLNCFPRKDARSVSSLGTLVWHERGYLRLIPLRSSTLMWNSFLARRVNWPKWPTDSSTTPGISTLSAGRASRGHQLAWTSASRLSRTTTDNQFGRQRFGFQTRDVETVLFVAGQRDLFNNLTNILRGPMQHVANTKSVFRFEGRADQLSVELPTNTGCLTCSRTAWRRTLVEFSSCSEISRINVTVRSAKATAGDTEHKNLGGAEGADRPFGRDFSLNGWTLATSKMNVEVTFDVAGHHSGRLTSGHYTSYRHQFDQHRSGSKQRIPSVLPADELERPSDTSG
ncbi:hypothetical protein niasHT_017565 [Heterodera trifolii]|uniref:Uncharacterized protein n=1 Tax=Heterodera trifolii TaxID=157864 RepID=A0ABD2L638_9BILA